MAAATQASMDGCFGNKPVTVVDQSDETNIQEEPIKFEPPLFKQRYRAVADILEQYDVSSVAEFGIAEANTIRYYKSLDSIKYIAGVDIDNELLCKIQFKATPLAMDYVHRRQHPLVIELLSGSLTDYDRRVANCDAVVMIEVIEHLHDDVLSELSPNIFGRIRPRIVVLTTPNSEFNPLFPDFSGFRHPDHKFEWTRVEFQSWCTPISEKYNYSVTYSGVGEPPPHSQHVGHCSQMAVFCRNDDTQDIHTNGEELNRDGENLEPYKLVIREEHPYQDPTVSMDDKIVNEALYYINMLAYDHKHSLQYGEIEYEDCSDDSVLEIELSQLLKFQRMSELCSDTVKLRSLLISAGVIFNGDSDVILHTLYCDESSDTDDDYDDDRSQELDNDLTVEQSAENCPVVNDETNEVESWDIEESWDTADNLHNNDDTCNRDNNTQENTSHSFLSSTECGQYSDAEDDWTVQTCHVSRSHDIDTVNTATTGISTNDNMSTNSLQTGNIFSNIAIPQTLVSNVTIPQQSTDVTGVSNIKCNKSSDWTENNDNIQCFKNYPIRSAKNCETVAKLESAVIICKNCGCKMTKLVNCDNLCGLSATCRTSFTERFRSALELRSNNKMYNRVVPEQFSDANG